MIIIKMAGGETHELSMSTKDFFYYIDKKADNFGFYQIHRDVYINVNNISSIFEIDV
ncbi:hypothetical protein ACWE42_21475 [Sutcliffiella cohnii]|uniref:hypothetical protein n=1 Tax=Sutcliffiella cohnii TaxID=33932 RepID=UPI002E1CCE06|nr:hypothetical protein [Sutcliffiella cohnii]